jgi:TonB family protein
LLLSRLLAIPLVATAAPLPAFAEERRRQAEPEPAGDVSAPDGGAPIAPPEPQPAPVDTTIVAPKALGALTAAYPEAASGDAEVVVELLVGTDGTTSEVRALSGGAPFSAATVEAAARWRFEPATRAGTPVRARIRVLVRFEEPRPAAASEAAPATAAPATAAVAPPTTPQPVPPAMEVRVTGQRLEAPQRLTRAEVRQLPGAFGDPFRAIEMLPGVTPIASGLPYFYVRGAPPGNVGYFFDGIAVPTLYHAAVGPAVIHPSFIGDVQLFSGAYPARYGRFAGGVVAGVAAEPEHRFRGEASIRLVDSGALVEAPFAGDRGDVMLAGRYSYTGALVSLLVPEIEVAYWDYQARLRYRLNATDSVTIFGFGAYDYLTAEDDFGVRETIYDVTFHRLDLRFERNTARRSLRLATTLGLDRTVSDAGDRIAIQSRRAGARLELSERLGSDVLLRAGSDVNFSRFDIDIDEQDDEDDDDEEDGDNSGLAEPGLSQEEDQQDEAADRAQFEALFSSRNDLLAGVWLDWVLSLGSGVTLTPGLRLDLYDTGGSVHVAPEPRVSARFELGERLALRHDIGLAHQAPSFAIPIPGFQATAEQGLQLGVQTSAGVELKLPEDISASVSVFQNVLFAGSDALGISQLDNADVSVDANSDRVTSHSYGFELYLRRPLTRRLGGFVSYTLSRSLRSVARLEGPSSFDRTHVLNFALAYDLGRAWRAGARFMFYTGIPAEVAYPKAAQNPPRSPPFFRIDWRLEKRWRLGDTGFWALVFEMLNSTLHKEILQYSCYAYGCAKEAIGPVTVPSIGVEVSY